MARNIYSTRARPDQMLKRERERLARLVNEYLKTRGAKAHILPGSFAIETACGTLTVHVDGAAIFCRFAEPEAAARQLRNKPSYQRLNPYSGKWNLHFGRTDAASAFALWKADLRDCYNSDV